MKVATPQDGASQLAPHSNRIELAGPIGQLTFPPICANCAAAATQSLLVRKPFVNVQTSSSSIGEARVPYCDACILEHRKEPDRLPFARRLMACFGVGIMFAAVGAASFALFLINEAVQTYGTHAQGAYALFVFAGVMLVIAWGCYRVAHRRSESFVIPAQSQITTAFDFSDDLSDSLGPERRIYAIRNERFAQEFEELNRNAVWSPQSPAVRKADRMFLVWAALALAFGFAMWWLGIG